MFGQLSEKFQNVLNQVRGYGVITDENIKSTVREVRKVLIDGDVNFKIVKTFIAKIENKAQGVKVSKSIKPGQQFVKIIHDELILLLGNKSKELKLKNTPSVILLVGLQGVGKTTTSGKLANYLKKINKSAVLVAADVYRPAAIEQLSKIGKTIGVDVYKDISKDPLKICKNALTIATKQKKDVVIIDTAGRLHVDEELMIEVKNIVNCTSPDEVLFVADGMSGQDAVKSAKSFHDSIPITGTILTKMDGDNRGGAALSITSVTGVPIKFIGNSETLDGIEVFDPKKIADRILGYGDVVSFVEKAQSVIDEKIAGNLNEKIQNNQFNLEDFKIQLQQIQKMGPLSGIMGMIPGNNTKMIKKMSMDDRQIKWTEAIINSMNKKERKNPNIINGSRRLRIANGSGRSVQDVNSLLKQFNQMKKMMKKMMKFKKFNFPLYGKM